MKKTKAMVFGTLLLILIVSAINMNIVGKPVPPIPPFKLNIIDAESHCFAEAHSGDCGDWMDEWGYLDASARMYCRYARSNSTICFPKMQPINGFKIKHHLTQWLDDNSGDYSCVTDGSTEEYIYFEVKSSAKTATLLISGTYNLSVCTDNYNAGCSFYLSLSPDCLFDFSESVEVFFGGSDSARGKFQSKPIVIDTNTIYTLFLGSSGDMDLTMSEPRSGMGDLGAYVSVFVQIIG